MRSRKDRIRHAILFEALGLLLATPLGAIAFDHPLDSIGIVVIVSATLAMAWNYAYNLGFDHALLRLRGSTAKTVRIRIAHALLFELGLLLILMPFIAWYLEVSLLTAAVMDMGFAAFYVVFAFVYNWGYDIAFPVPTERLR